MNKFLDQYIGLVKKFVPQKERLPCVGLDIGASSCKLVEVSWLTEEFQVSHWAIEPIENGDVKGAVTKILARLPNPPKSPHTAIFGKGTLIRYIDMPSMSLDDLKKSFGFEADKYFPFSQDQIYIDCHILESSAATNKMSVLVAAAKRDMIDARISFLRELGLQTDFIGLNSIAIINSLSSSLKNDKNNPPEKGKTAVAVLDLGEHVSNLTLMVDFLPRFNRDIYIGGREFTRTISNALGLNFGEAEKLKCEPKERAAEVVSATEAAINHIISELRLSFDYFVTEKNVPITQLYLTGGGAQLEGIEAALSKGLEMPVKVWNPFLTVSMAGQINREEVVKQSGRLGVALGLALSA